MKTLGDGVMAVFTSAVQAVSCAVAIQRAVAEHNRERPGRELEVRVGIHAGEPLEEEGDYHGTAVVVAKRLCDAAGARRGERGRRCGCGGVGRPRGRCPDLRRPGPG